MASNIPDSLRKHEIPGRVAFASGQGALPKINVTAARSSAEIYLHGAHVTGFQKSGEAPLLFLSRRSQFASGKSIRGGVPVIYPWFGARDNDVMHGFARVTGWELARTAATPAGEVTLRFHLPASASAGTGWAAANVDFIVTVGDRLTMELTAAHTATGRTLEFENCLHTYFAVGDIAQVSLTGLQGVPFLDNATGAGGARQVESDPRLRITRETNRIYLDTPDTVEIRDESLRRVIRVEKSGSRSTVVWNPWTTQKMPDDFDPAEHRNMLCVESANVKQNRVSLGPGQTATLKVILSSQPL